MPATWEPPSPQVAELIRATARQLLAAPEEMFAEMDDAVLSAVPALAADTVIAGETRASNRANSVRWLTANVQRPGAAVGSDLTPEALDIARDVVRRGIDREALLTGYRQGQNVAWLRWMQAATAASDDADTLGELLHVTARSLFSFVDSILAGVDAQMARERDQLLGGSLALRVETVSLVLEGAPISEERAGGRLGYELANDHTALVLWSEEPVPDQGLLERTAELLARAAGARRPFTLPAGTSVLWAWFAGGGAEPAVLRAALQDAPPDVRVAAGTRAPGIAGFRRSHHEALAAQRLMMRRRPSEPLIAYDEVEIVVLAGSDEDRAARFVAATLGELAQAEELRETLRVYLQEHASASRAARQLFTHRNTVLNRVARAERLLPRPLAGRDLSVALALELRHWLP